MQWPVHRAAPDYAWCFSLQVMPIGGDHGSPPVQRPAQRVHHPTQQFRAHRHLQPATSAGHQIATLQSLIGSQQDAVNASPVQVEDQTLYASGEIHQFIGHGPW